LAKRGCKGMGHRKRENISSRTGEKVYWNLLPNSRH
jgi:hypothetical protein